LKKLIIGTAQLVRQYGISNHSKKKSSKNIFEFLEFCLKNSINSFDMASDYGSEKIIGEFIKSNKVKKIFLSTKIPSLKKIKDIHKIDSIKRQIEVSFKNLNIDSLESIYFHDEADYHFFKKKKLEIRKMIKNYKIKKLGFSIYSKKIFRNIKNEKYIDTIQLPINIINKDFNNLNSKKNIVARSIFLQGLLINKKINTKNILLKNFNKILFDFANDKNIDLYSICLNYILKNKKINQFIIGFDNIDQLKNLISFKNHTFDGKNTELISKLVSKKNYRKIIDPRKW